MKKIKLAACSGLAAAALVLGLQMADIAQAASGKSVTVHVGTGDWADANIKAYVKPFEEATGIDVVPVKGWSTYSELKLWQDSNNVEVDVMYMPPSDAVAANQQGWLQKIDYSLYSAEQLDKIKPAAKPPFGVGAL